MTTIKDLMWKVINLYPANHKSIHSSGTSLCKAKSIPMLDTFKSNLAKAGINWHDLDCTEKVKPLIREIHPEADSICSAVPDIRGNKYLNYAINPYDLEHTDVTIIRAKFGVAQTGMVWIAENSIPIHTLKHISRHLIILLHPDKMVKNMTEAYEEIYYNESIYGSFFLPETSPQALSIHICFV